MRNLAPFLTRLAFEPPAFRNVARYLKSKTKCLPFCIVTGRQQLRSSDINTCRSLAQRSNTRRRFYSLSISALRMEQFANPAARVELTYYTRTISTSTQNASVWSIDSCSAPSDCFSLCTNSLTYLLIYRIGLRYFRLLYWLLQSVQCGMSMMALCPPHFGSIRPTHLENSSNRPINVPLGRHKYGKSSLTQTRIVRFFSHFNI